MKGFLVFLGKRLAMMAASLCVIIAVSYSLMWYAPGNFLDIQRAQTAMASQLGHNAQAMEQQKKLFNERYGLDKPLPAQILTYVQRAATWDFGPSFQNPTLMIQDMVAEKLPRTLLVVALGVGLALLAGIPMGMVAAFKRNSWVDYIVTGFSMIGQIIPSYVLAVALLLLFAGAVWNVLPLGGWSNPLKLRELILPVITVALGPMAGIARYMRNQVAETLSQDFIRTARSKGLPAHRVVIRHTLRNSLLPVITVTAPQIAYLLVGSVYIESMFRIPGIGQMFANANAARDYPVMVTGVVVLSLSVMLCNLLADLLYAALDPRIRLDA